MALQFVGHEKVFGFAGGLSTQVYSEDESKVEIKRKRQLVFNKGEIFCIIYMVDSHENTTQGYYFLI